MKYPPIIGFVRYSLPAGYRENKYPDFFKPEYIDYRLDIFLNVTLKSFQEQSDKNFIVFLLHSKDLPEKYKDVFRNIEENNSFIHNAYFSDSEAKNINAIIKTLLAEYVNDNDAFITFRIDNDDALPRDYISRLRVYQKPEFVGHAIYIPNFIAVQRIKENKYLYKDEYYPFNSMGLAYISNQTDYQSVMHLKDHRTIYKKCPVILLPGYGGIMTINGRNAGNNIFFLKTVMPNTISFGRSYSCKEETLLSLLKNRNYPDIDFKCLHICKRNIFLQIIKKISSIIKKCIKK